MFRSKAFLQSLSLVSSHFLGSFFPGFLPSQNFRIYFLTIPFCSDPCVLLLPLSRIHIFLLSHHCTAGLLFHKLLSLFEYSILDFQTVKIITSQLLLSSLFARHLNILTITFLPFNVICSFCPLLGFPHLDFPNHH